MTKEDFSVGAMNLATVERKEISWLWHPYIPRGCITIVEGDPGVGKSTVVSDIAARVTAGRTMPFWEQNAQERPAGVVWLTGEEDLAETMRPRLEAAGGDARLVTVRQYFVPFGDYQHSEMTIGNIEVITWDAMRNGAVLVVVDPLNAFLPEGASVISDPSMRRALRPVQELARRTGVAVVIVRHNRKQQGGGLIHAGAGSMAIGAVSRSVLAFVPNPSAPGEHLMVPAKSNYTAEGPSLRYRVVDRSGVAGVEWLGASEVTKTDVERAKNDGQKRPRERAKTALMERLSAGGLASKEVAQLAADVGVSTPTLERALTELGGHRAKTGYKGGWEWRLAPKEIKTIEGDHSSD